MVQTKTQLEIRCFLKVWLDKITPPTPFMSLGTIFLVLPGTGNTKELGYPYPKDMEVCGDVDPPTYRSRYWFLVRTLFVPQLFMEDKILENILPLLCVCLFLIEKIS